MKPSAARGGQGGTACATGWGLGGGVCLWSAHTGTRLVTAVPLGRWHSWNAAVSFAQYVRCLVCVCAYGRRTPALAWSRAVPLGRWHCWNAAVSFAQHVRCLVCFSLPAAALSSDSEAGDSVPWHRTYRYWSNPETGHHCLWSSLPSNKPAVAHKPVIACLSTGLIGG